MKLIQKRHYHHRGIIGIESAIVLIAFIIVTAALAFVVLNMGFATTQKAKTSIISSLGEAISGLIMSGKVIGSGHIADDAINATAIPIKIAGGGGSYDLANTTAAIKFQSNSITYDDIYAGTLLGTFTSLESATNFAVNAYPNGDFANLDVDPFGDAGWPTETTAFIYWTGNTNNNDILDSGEHAVLAIVFAQNDRPNSLDTIQAEIIGPVGAALTIKRHIPIITTQVVDLG